MCGPSEDMPVHNFRLAAQTAHSFGDSVIHLTDLVVHIALNILRRAPPNKSEMGTGKQHGWGTERTPKIYSLEPETARHSGKRNWDRR
jgi:hypothetical protein